MNCTASTLLVFAGPCLAALAAAQPPAATATAPYQAWQHAGELTILTTPDGADLPASASVQDFPLLVRLHRDCLRFEQVKAQGEDLRFSTSSGAPLAYQIDEWDAAQGTASIWVRVPHIDGNARQTLRLHWGNAAAASESNGAAVFDRSNGYLSVWHLGEVVRDDVGTLQSQDVGTTATTGMIGNGRHFAGGQGVSCGEQITSYPSADRPHTTQAWFRAQRPNTTIIGWGNEGGGRGSKVRLQLRSPPHLHVDSDFADVNSERTLPMAAWIHVVHTYAGGEGRIYVDGKLDGSATPTLDIKRPARLWIGGWYDHYDFVGDVDEVRVSNVARSADWVRLEFENQKRLPTLVGPVVQPGDAFGVSPAQITVPEGGSATLTAQAGGAQKAYWTLIAAGRTTRVAVDRLTFTFEAGRVSGNRTATLRFEAIYPHAVKAQDIPITIEESIPEPEFTLRAPAQWDGRTVIEVVPQIINAAALQAKAAGALNHAWHVAGPAVIKETAPGKLILKRAQNSGQLTVTTTIDNGGRPATRAVTIAVAEPPRDAWVQRTPSSNEQPVDGQFYARDDQNRGTLFCTGTLTEPADSVFLKLYAGERLVQVESSKPAADRSYALSVQLQPGLIEYRVEFGTQTGTRETVRHAAANLVCGDAYLINGQSNAVATDWGEDEPTYHSRWIRTFGSMSDSPQGVELWGEATHRSRDGEKLQIGYWGMELARHLVERQAMPICIVNGAVGGSRIDQHQRHAEDPEDMTTIYGRLLWRVRRAKLTHGIRGVLWHQGENDQGADGPTGGFGWQTYRQHFIDLAAAWKQDFQNLQHYYVFQIWPKSCAMGIDGSDNRLREVQRNLPAAFSNLSIMSTLGIEPPGGCHFPAAGYAEFARLICPLVERDHYGVEPAASITPANLDRAYLANDDEDAVVLEFDQPMQWDDALASQFYLDGEKGRVASGSVAGNVVTLRLAAPCAAKTITYLDSREWNQRTLLRGQNGLAALTFCEVPLQH